MCSSSAVAKSTVSILYIDKLRICAFDLCLFGRISRLLRRHDEYVTIALFVMHISSSVDRFLLFFFFYSVARTLTFVQKRPIGLGIKNNLGSLRRLDLCCSRYYSSFLSSPFSLERDDHSFYSRAAHSTNSLISRSLTRDI